MPNFTVDAGIPLPELDDPEPIEDSRWVPFKPHKTKCRNDAHVPQVGRCIKCGDIFPCPSGNCGHIDCAEAGNGTDLPEWLKPNYIQES